MLTIFKGDDTGGTFGRPLHFTINTGADVDLAGCRAEFEFDGIVKTFERIVAGASVEIVFTHQETADMKTGVRFAKFRIIDADGKIRTFDNSLAVKVTTHVGDAYPGSDSTSITIGNVISWSQVVNKPDLTDVRDLDPEASTMGDVMRTVNRLLSAFRACIAVALLAVPALAEDAAEVLPLYAPLKDLPGKTQIMTNIVEYVATHGGGAAGTDGQAVTNIVDGIVARNARDKGDLAVYERLAVNTTPPSGFIGLWTPPHYDFAYEKTEDRLATESWVLASTIPASFNGPNIQVDLWGENEDGYFPRKFSLESDYPLMLVDPDYDFGAVFFYADTYFASYATFGVEMLLDQHIRNAGEFTEDYEYDAEAAIFANGIRYTPHVDHVRDLQDYALLFPENSGTLATIEEVEKKLPTEEKLKEVAGAAMNTIWDEELGVTWQAKMVGGNLYYIAVTNTNITAIK